MPAADLTKDLSAVLDWIFAEDPMAHPALAARARLLFLDTTGCMVAGLAKPELRALAAEFAESEAGPVHLPSSEIGLTASAAAALAGIAACWDEACEGLARAHGRPGLHAFPPALGLGLQQNRTLGDVLAALVTGYEVAGRLGEVLRIKPEMHVDGTWGTFGAIAAAARLGAPDFKTAAEIAAAAIDAAACQMPFSLYLPVARGATARNSYVGHAVQHALLQVSAAGAGLTAPAGALATLDRLAYQGLSTATPMAPPGEWLVEQGYLKPYAAVRHVHYGAAAAIERHRDKGPDTRHIKNIRLSVYEEAITYCGNRAPKTATQAQFSLSYGLAWALMHGDLGPDAYAADALADPEVTRLEALIEVVPDAVLTRENRRGATLTVESAQGTEIHTVDAVPGDPVMPFSADAVRDKFRRYAGPHFGDTTATAIADAILDGPLDQPLGTIFESSVLK
jgi:2-methylcitrate dehydratase PrpD